MKAKKIILWIAGGIVALLLIVVGTGVFLLNHSQRFRAYLLQRVEQSIHESTGAQLTVRDFNVALGELRVDLYGIVVHGKEPASQRPLLTADHLGLAIKIDSVLRRKWRLRSVTADRPVAAISVDQSGRSNLPTPPQP